MRTKKSIYNMSASLLAQIISLICGLITPRLILSSFGSTYNGVVNSATQFLGFVAILRLGVTGATRVALYKTLAVEDTLGTSRIMKATKIYMRKIAFIIVVYTIALMFVYPLIAHNELNGWECSLIIGIVSISTFAQYFFGISNTTLLSADQSEYVNSLIGIMTTVMNTIVTMGLIRLNQNIFIVKLGSSIVFLLFPIVMELYVKKRYHLTNKCEADDSAIKQRGEVVFHSIANIIHENTDIILLTIFTDAKMISVYTVYYLVVGKIKTLLQVVTGGIEAVFGNMWVKGEKKILDQAFSGLEFLVFSFTAVVFSCTGLLILSFIGLYTKGVTDIEYIRIDLALLITITEAVFCIRQPYLLLVQATGKYKETKNGAMIEAIVNIGSSIILVNILGICGVIIGTLLANLIRTTQYVWFVSKYILQRSLKDVFARVGVLFLNVVIIVALIKPMTSLVEPSQGWINWVTCGIIAFVISSATTLVTGFIFYRANLIYILKKINGLRKV